MKTRYYITTVILDGGNILKGEKDNCKDYIDQQVKKIQLFNESKVRGKIMEKKEFLVVYEDIWHNKESQRTTKIGDTIKEFIKSYELTPFDKIDFERYNSDDPYDVGTMGLGFYDIDFYEEDEEYCGRIMIFSL